MDGAALELVDALRKIRGEHERLKLEREADPAKTASRADERRLDGREQLTRRSVLTVLWTLRIECELVQLSWSGERDERKERNR